MLVKLTTSCTVDTNDANSSVKWTGREDFELSEVKKLAIYFAEWFTRKQTKFRSLLRNGFTLEMIQKKINQKNGKQH